MIVLSGALVLVALVLLVFGALDRNLPYVYASIGVSVLSLLLLLVGILQRRGELVGDDDEAVTPVTDTSAERVPALAGAGSDESRTAPVGDGVEHTAELEVPAAASAQPTVSRRVTPDDAPADDAPARQQDEDDLEDDEALEDDDLEDGDQEDDPASVGAEDEVAEDTDQDAEEDEGVTVLVVSGRPRYHLEGCRVLRGKQPQPLHRDDARMHGFSPCGVCKPDADENPDDRGPVAATSPNGEGGASFTEALFGEPLFAESSPEDAGRVPTSALPDRPVQPVLPEVVPAPAAGRPAAEPAPAELHGDDPADDTTLPSTDEPAPEPAPDVAGNPDEPSPVAPAVDEPVAAADAPAQTADEQELTADEAPAPDDVAQAETAASEGGAANEGTPVAVAPEGKPAKGAKAAKKAPAKGAKPAKKVPAKGAKAPVKGAKAAKKAAPAAAAPAAAPAVKRPVVRAVRADALRLGAPGTGTSTTRVSARGAAPAATTAPVVVVPDRDRYHRPECRFVRDATDATSLPKTSATRQGYAACGVCKP